MEAYTRTESKEIILEMGSGSNLAQEITSDVPRIDLPSGSGASLDSHVDSIIKSIEKKVRQSGKDVNPSRPSIWKVPPELRNLDAEAFQPKVVSIGPLHHGKEMLLPGEKYKLQFIQQHVLNNTSNLRKCADILFKSVLKAREHYSENINMSDEEFAEMLVVDGCFIVIYLAINSEIVEYNHLIDIELLGWRAGGLLSDIMLLENQIPLFVLNKIFEEIGNLFCKQGRKFFDFVYHYFLPGELNCPHDLEFASHLLHFQQMLLNRYLMGDHKHRCSPWMPDDLVKKLLYISCVPLRGLFYLIFSHDCSVFFGAGEEWSPLSTIPCSTELLKAGIKLKKKSHLLLLRPFMSSCLQVSFTKGTLEIPFLSLTREAAHMLRNLMAFEQGYNGVIKCTTIYCGFMNDIIQTVYDVAILRKSGILENKIGTDAAMVEFLNSLCTGVNISREINSVFYEYRHYYKLTKDVEKFCKVPHHRWRASLMSNYFSNPWTFLSVLAAVLLLSLTAIQAFFTVYPRG